MDYLFPYPKMGHSFLEILEDPLTRKLLGHEAIHAEKTPFISGVTSRLGFLLHDPLKHLSFLKIGYTALEAFLQANATGPPLDFDSVPIIIPDMYRDETLPMLKQEMLQYLSVDGSAAYALTPRIELFWLAKVVMSHDVLAEIGFNGRRARFRVNFWHQKLLAEKSDKLREVIYHDADILEQQLFSRFQNKSAASEQHFIEFLTERAVIRTYYGDDVKAREDLTRAAKIRHFQFALTGALGKRTKFQDRDLSQLVVLAKSRDHEPEPYNSRKSSRAEGASSRKSSWTESTRSPMLRPKSPSGLSYRPISPTSSVVVSPDTDRPVSPFSIKHHPVSPKPSATQPENVPLKDDTLLEAILFKQRATYEPQPTQISDRSALPPDLVHLDPSEQPVLFPMDSIILLSTASSISNTSPDDGLTREETLPYAERVLKGGSSNWQVYTQALLVRSRIEGYKSRTVERGLLQLQALVDQVIAETSDSQSSSSRGAHSTEEANSDTPATFLPKPKMSESASVAERLQYIYQLSPPLRWELEAELAQRWTQLGGLKSALDIYERLQMNAEVALCLAATDQEGQATKLLESLLFEPDSDKDSVLKLRKPTPTDAPRLLCILGDIEQQPKYFVLAWTISNQRYSRAQRSLGRHFMRKRDLASAAAAYTLALKNSRLDTATWFALGCVQLELKDYAAAVESFTRVVQLEDKDAEGWSNLAVALLRLPPPTVPENDELTPQPAPDEEVGSIPQPSASNPYKHVQEALRALRRAADLKRSDARIWDNYLTVAASIPPSQGTPWNEIIHAQGRMIELRGTKQGEQSIDLNILKVLISHVTQAYEYPRNEEPDYTTTTTHTHEHDHDHDHDHDVHDVNQPEPHTSPHLHHHSNKRSIMPFTARAFLRLIDTQITPIATSAKLFSLLAQVSHWRHRPHESLSYLEKAWRATTAQPSVYDTQPGWDGVVHATLDLVDGYTRLGDQERERTGGRVESGWKFKAKSAMRSVLGRGRDWEGTETWNQLQSAMDKLSGT